MSDKKKPVHDVRLGSVNAAVWKRETENGSRYSVTIRRSYKQGEEWKSTDYFGDEHLPAVNKACEKALDWIMAQGKP